MEVFVSRPCFSSINFLCSALRRVPKRLQFLKQSSQCLHCKCHKSRYEGRPLNCFHSRSSLVVWFFFLLAPQAIGLKLPSAFFPAKRIYLSLFPLCFSVQVNKKGRDEASFAFTGKQPSEAKGDKTSNHLITGFKRCWRIQMKRKWLAPLCYRNIKKKNSLKW